MNFHGSAENVYLDQHCAVLHAHLRNVNGELVDSEIDLNQILGNNWGQFAWGGSGFADSAQNIRFDFEGDAHVPVLRAELNDGQGAFILRDVNLGERLGNNNGQFQFAENIEGHENDHC